MECYHCGQENNDEAVFCKQCGQRVDGKMQCPKCNQQIDCDSQFCEFCGNAVQEEQETNTEIIETEINPQDEELPSSNFVSFQKFKLGSKKIFEIGSGVFSMISVFFSLLFTFFIGLNATGSSRIGADENLGYSQSLNIFYYFGECYNNSSIISKNYPPFYVSNYYFTTIMGTLLSLAIITTVVIFAIISVVRYVNYSNGRTSKSYSNFALATSISFILGVTLFYAFNSVSYEYSTAEISLKLNNYTTAGIALSTTFIILTYICKTATLGKELTSQQNLRKFCFSALGIVALSFMAVMIASPSIVIKIDNAETMSFNFLGAMAYLSIVYLGKNATGYAVISSKQYADAPTDIYTNLIIGFIIEIAMIVMVILMIATLLKNLSNNDKQSNYKGLGIGIATCILSIVNLIITLTVENQLIEYIDSDTVNYSVSIYPLVLIVIISVIYLVIEIIHSVVNVNSKSAKI
ncbi:MAG: zinc ribbon domain-containing protein [Clostridia bacterium]|nr:zinc ribbon domain-containing protein [Clostridia bacterium]